MLHVHARDVPIPNLHLFQEEFEKLRDHKVSQKHQKIVKFGKVSARKSF